MTDMYATTTGLADTTGYAERPQMPDGPGNWTLASTAVAHIGPAEHGHERFFIVWTWRDES